MTECDILNALDDYQMNISEINRLQSIAVLQSDGFSTQSIRGQRNKQRLYKMESEVHTLNHGVKHAPLTDLQETIIDCLMDGMTIVDIAKHVSHSRATVYKNLDAAVKGIQTVLQ